MKLISILAFILMFSMAYADCSSTGWETDINCWRQDCSIMGWDATAACSTMGTNNLIIFASILAFVVLAAGFAYLHTKSQNQVWSSIWLSLMFVMILVAIMGMQLQANESGDTQTSGIMTILFGVIFWIFVIIMLFFSVNLVRGFFGLMQEAVNGKKK